MARILAVLLFLAACSNAFAAAGPYYILFDSEGYVLQIVSETGLREFVLVNLTVDIPLDVRCQCYKFIDGQFVLDEAKYALWLNPQPVSTPDAIQ